MLCPPLARMAQVVHLIPAPHPGGHVVLHLHHAGPTGPNGTQQFPKLTDCELCCLLKPLIEEHILRVYAKTSNAQSAQNLLANLHPITKQAITIFTEIEKKHGYCSCECVGAMRRVQAASGGLCLPVFEALMVCLSFADLEIRLIKAQKRATPANGKPHGELTVIDPRHTKYHEHAQPPSPTAPELDIDTLVEEFQKIVEREKELRELIKQTGHSDDYK